MSDAVAGVIISLAVNGGDQLSSATDRVQAKLKSVEQAGLDASRAAATSSAASDQAKRALDDVDTKLEVSYHKLRRIANVLGRLAKRGAEALGDTNAAEEIDITARATGEALHAGRLATQAGNLLGPEVGVPLGIAVAAGTFAYEEATGLQALNERNIARSRQVAREEIEAREKALDKRDAGFARDRENFIEEQARQKAEIAKLNAALGGGGFR